MQSHSTNTPRDVTRQFTDEDIWAISSPDADITYRPVPDPAPPADVPVWRVCFDLAYDLNQHLGLDINGEIILGRGEDADGFVSFRVFDCEPLGVSRQHIMLRPANNKLYMIDLGSTNGTWLNGHSIGVNSPYSLSHGDLIRLGELELVTRIIKRPAGHTSALQTDANTFDTLLAMAQSITAQLDLDDVFKEALAMIISSTSADEASIWLVDEQTGKLFIEAEQGINDEQFKKARLSVNDTLAGRVIETGQPVRAGRPTTNERVKVKTGYLVDAVIYVPLTVGGVNIGVFSAAHHTTGKSFSQNDEQLMSTIATLTAIAVQNARQFQAASYALNRYSKVMTAVHYALSLNVREALQTAAGYIGLLGSSQGLSEEANEMTLNLEAVTGDAANLIGRLVELTSSVDVTLIHHQKCDLVDVVTQALSFLQPVVAEKRINLEYKTFGGPYLIQGDAGQLQRAIMGLVTNFIVRALPESTIEADLVFSESDVIIRISDATVELMQDGLALDIEEYFLSESSSGYQVEAGLNLALAWSAVEAHRGTLRVLSVEGEAREFIINLPAALRLL